MAAGLRNLSVVSSMSLVSSPRLLASDADMKACFFLSKGNSSPSITTIHLRMVRMLANTPALLYLLIVFGFFAGKFTLGPALDIFLILLAGGRLPARPAMVSAAARI